MLLLARTIPEEYGFRLLLHLFQRQMDHRPSDAPLFFLAVPVEPIKDWFHFAFYDAVRLFSRQKSACSLVESN